MMIHWLIGFNIVLESEKPYMTTPTRVDKSLEMVILNQFTMDPTLN